MCLDKCRCVTFDKTDGLAEAHLYLACLIANYPMYKTGNMCETVHIHITRAEILFTYYLFYLFQFCSALFNHTFSIIEDTKYDRLC